MEKSRPLQLPPDVQFKPWRPWVLVQVGIGAAIVGVLFGLMLVWVLGMGPFDGSRYHLWRWEADHVTSSAFSLMGIGPDPDDAEGEESIRSYFGLTSQIRAEMDAADPDEGLIEVLTNERAAYENDVERVVERFIDEAAREAGLQRGLPLFGGVDVIWPPVDFELTNPPQLLVKSPRAEIRRAADRLLKNDLTLEEVERVEAKENDEDTSALVVSVGGIAAYPAIVRENRSYGSLLNTASHEWAHHYLAFYPLGEQWAASQEGKTLNETVADIVGREMAAMIREMHPIDLPVEEDGRRPPGPERTVDFNETMRQLRLDVDALLADGKVEEAEALMEETRLFLADNGVFIREINQAYFAFYGTYAGSPQSSDPIGDKVDMVWEATGDLGTFLALVREVESEEDLDNVIERLEGVAAAAR